MRVLLLFCLCLSVFVACKPPSRNKAAELAPAAASESSVDGLKRFWQVPAFELTDQDGRTFNSVQMLGKIWVVDFFYTTCPGPCPALTSRLSELHQTFAGEGQLGFLSISSDPEKDQPPVLKKYAQKFGADERWLFLTGRADSIFSLANQGFKLSLTRTESGAEPVTHSTRMVLIDKAGWVRGFYEGVGEDSSSASQLLSDGIRLLLKESQ